MKEVILVDENDQEVGTMEKIQAHEQALLHRAFSVFIFNSKGEMLLQQRAENKYHSATLWTNACCSHPSPGEVTKEAAERRLYEELGFTALLRKAFTFTYKTEFDNGLTEYEFDHVYTGVYDGPIVPDRNEVMDCKYLGMEELEKSLRDNPEQYTSWFAIALPELQQWMKNNKID